MNRKTEVMIGILLIASVATGIVAAAVITGTTEGPVHWDSPDGPSITTVDADVDESVPIRYGTVDLGHTKFHSDGHTAATVDGWGSSHLSLSEIDANNELTIHRSGEIVSVEGDVNTLEINNDGFETGFFDAVRLSVSGDTTISLTTPSTDSDYIAIVDSDTDETIDAVHSSESTIEFTVSESRDLRFDGQDVEISDPEPDDGEILSESHDIEISAHIAHPKQDDVTVEFLDADDGSVIGSETITEDGRVSTTWDAPDMGANEWFVRTEQDGNTHESDIWELNTPHELQIKDEQTSELLDDLESEIEVRFFEVGEEEGPIVTRETDDGVIDLEGLPSDKDLLVDADVEDYFSRTIIIRSIAEQQTIYLLNQTADVSDVSFELNDRSGNFPAETSRVIIRKPIGDDDDTSYQTIIGNTFGANDRVDALLERGDRYRIVVENADGQSRSFGSYVADRSSDVVPLEIGEITISPPDADGYVLDSREITVEVDGEERQAIRIAYRDDSETTNSVSIEVFEQHNQNNSIFGPEEIQGNIWAETIVIPESDENVSTWIVDYEIDREIDDEVVTGQQPVGELTDVDWPLSSTLLQILGLGAILLVAGLFGGHLSQIGAVVTVAVAWVLVAIGFVSIPIEFLVAAGVVAILMLIGTDRNEGGQPI